MGPTRKQVVGHGWEGKSITVGCAEQLLFGDTLGFFSFKLVDSVKSTDTVFWMELTSG